MVNALALIIVAQFFLYGMLPFRPVAAIFYLGVTLGLAGLYEEQEGKPTGIVPDLVAAAEFSIWPVIVLVGTARAWMARSRPAAAPAKPPPPRR